MLTANVKLSEPIYRMQADTLSIRDRHKARLNICRPAYAQLEASEKPRPASRRKIAEALGIDPDFLVG